MNKSEVMRKMWDEGKSVSEISKELGCHYSYVYGVIERHVGKDNMRDRVKDRNEQTKSSEFRKLWDEGKTIGEIAKMTNSNYSYVWSVIEKYRKEGK